MSKKLKTINIKGKEYVEVNERIRYFRENYPQGSIVTELVSNVDGVCVFKATAYNMDAIIATGHAYEKEGSTFINKTSYIENCESSAIGRCLGIAGIGIDGSVASAEEVQTAIANQVDKETINRALEKLRQSKEKDDFDTAQDIYNWAEKQNCIIVKDEYAKLYEGAK